MGIHCRVGLVDHIHRHVHQRRCLESRNVLVGVHGGYSCWIASAFAGEGSLPERKGRRYRTDAGACWNGGRHGNARALALVRIRACFRYAAVWRRRIVVGHGGVHGFMGFVLHEARYAAYRALCSVFSHARVRLLCVRTRCANIDCDRVHRVPPVFLDSLPQEPQCERRRSGKRGRRGFSQRVQCTGVCENRTGNRGGDDGCLVVLEHGEQRNRAVAP